MLLSSGKDLTTQSKEQICLVTLAPSQLRGTSSEEPDELEGELVCGSTEESE